MRIRNFLLWLQSLFILDKEKKYYFDLFVRNRKWNSTVPNEDEKLRWGTIEAFVKEIVGQRKDELTILDVGSGRGWLTSLLSKYGKAEGLEPVGPVVDHSRKLFPGITFHNKSLLEFAASQLTFDLIVSSEVLEHIPDSGKDNFVLNLKKLLKDEGHVIITTPRKEILEMLPQKPGQPIEDWMTEHEVRDLFTRNRFDVVDNTVLQMRYEGEIRDVYQVWMFRI
jgi:2-polyprenyl-3-methyl-5-hydroxy-6-metoxy-1,4-benzoquinol methylase